METTQMAKAQPGSTGLAGLEDSISVHLPVQHSIPQNGSSVEAEPLLTQLVTKTALYPSELISIMVRMKFKFYTLLSTSYHQILLRLQMIWKIFA